MAVRSATAGTNTCAATPRLPACTASTSGGFGKRLAKLDISQFGAVACGGYRWQWDNGINVAARLGVGYGRYTVTSKQTGPIAEEAALASRQALAMVPIEIESELSLGYSF